ncbi:MAG: hypothetical protein ACREN8_07995 [Candidatus Dormibacteraceae bacterium]
MRELKADERVTLHSASLLMKDLASEHLDLAHEAWLDGDERSLRNRLDTAKSYKKNANVLASLYHEAGDDV